MSEISRSAETTLRIKHDRNLANRFENFFDKLFLNYPDKLKIVDWNFFDVTGKIKELFSPIVLTSQVLYLSELLFSFLVIVKELSLLYFENGS